MTSRLLSLVIPVFNEEDSLHTFLGAVRPHVQDALRAMGQGSRAEYVFVDDGSTDATAKIIRMLCSEQPDVRLVKLSRNFGKEAALAAGLDAAAGDAVIPIDVDLQDPPDVIPKLARAWLAGADIVNAKRIERTGDTWSKRMIAKAFYKIFNAISPEKLPENVGDFRLLSRRAVNVICALPERARMNKALFSWVGFKTTTVEYRRPARSIGTSKWPLIKLWNLALDGITASTIAPLRVWSFVGAAMAAAAFLYALLLGGRTLLFGADVPGYASLMVAVLMLGGLQLISLGMIGEYIGRIAKEVRGRPLYIVEEEFGRERAHKRSPPNVAVCDSVSARRTAVALGERPEEVAGE